MKPPDISPEDRKEITYLEECMWLESTRFDLAFQELRFAEDFVEFGRSGRVYQREEIIRTQSDEIRAKLPLHDLQIRVVDVKTVLVTYNSEAVYEGVTEYARRSSLWSRTSSGWVMRFHQGTPYGPLVQS
jgi:hypothetical protein